MKTTTGKQKYKYPETVHKKWVINNIITKEILEKTKLDLGKIGVSNFSPHPKKIFEPFSIDPDTIKMVLVNSTYPLTMPNGAPYQQFPPILKEIWQKLSDSEEWEKVEDYCRPDLSDFLWCMKLNTNLTTNSKGVWDELMVNLFTYFGECTDRYLFVFLDEPSFNKYSKYVAKKHEVLYKFDPVAIREYFKHQWGITYQYGLPF